MRTASWIILDAVDKVRTWSPSMEVDSSDSSLGAASAMPDRDNTTIVSASLSVSLFRERQGEEWPSLPQVVINWPPEMSNTGGPRLIGSHQDGRAVCICGGSRGVVGLRIVSVARSSSGISPCDAG